MQNNCQVMWTTLFENAIMFYQVVPRTLAQNAGMDATSVIAEMYAAHKAGQGGVGIDVNNCVAADRGVLDLLLTKREAIKMATEVCEILAVLAVLLGACMPHCS